MCNCECEQCGRANCGAVKQVFPDYCAPLCCLGVTGVAFSLVVLRWTPPAREQACEQSVLGVGVVFESLCLYLCKWDHFARWCKWALAPVCPCLQLKSFWIEPKCRDFVPVLLSDISTGPLIWTHTVSANELHLLSCWHSKSDNEFEHMQCCCRFVCTKRILARGIDYMYYYIRLVLLHQM